MAFGYARVKPDAFSDITDVRVRNDRIMQDIANQNRNWEAQQAAAEFDAWQKQNARKDYGYYDKGLAIQNGFKTQPFAGKAPSISHGLASLGITPDGKLTFGSHGSNKVMPFRRKPVFKTDENGNPTPLSADEEAILHQESDKTSQQAAAEAASGAPVQNSGEGSNSIENPANAQHSPWYDFLKHPQNTPYEIEQMRNQGILRDAAIAAAMNKPVFFPEADTLSEPMAKLTGQQSGLAQSAMQQFTTRQGMASDAYKMATGLATQYASNAIQADIQARKFKADAEEAKRNADVIGDQAEALYGSMPDDMKAISGKPEFLEVVRNKYNKELQNLAQAYDALKRQQAVFQNDAQSKEEQYQSYLAKSKAFRNGASKVSKDWELGLDFGGGEEIAAPKVVGNDIRFAGQGDIGINAAGAYGNFSNPKNEASATSTPNTTAPTAPAATNGTSGKGNLVFKNGKVIKSSAPKSNSNFEEGSAERDFENLANEYFKIGRFGVGGAWQNLDTQVQRRALDDNWLRKINGVKQKLALDLRNNPESFAKHRHLFDFIRSGNQFGDTNKLLESAANPPQSYDLSYYANQFNATGDEVERGDLQYYLAILNEGGALTMPEVKHLEKMLKERFPVTNLNGEKKPLLQQNGLKIKFFKATNEDGSPMIDGKEQLYFVPLKDSFK